MTLPILRRIRIHFNCINYYNCNIIIEYQLHTYDLYDLIFLRMYTQQWFRIYHDMDHLIHCSIIPIHNVGYLNTTTTHDQDILDFSSAQHAAAFDLILALSSFSNFLVAPLYYLQGSYHVHNIVSILFTSML